MLPVRAQRRLMELRRQLFRTYHVGRHVVDLVDHEVDGHGLQGLATEREGANQTFIPLWYSSSALMGSALSKEKLMKSSRPMPASLRRSATAASTLVSRASRSMSLVARASTVRASTL